MYRAVDGFLLPNPGGHRRQFTGVLHHSIHRGSICFTHLHHLHLRGAGETSAPGRDVSLQHAQRPQQAHPVLVSTHTHTHPTREQLCPNYHLHMFLLVILVLLGPLISSKFFVLNHDSFQLCVHRAKTAKQQHPATLAGEEHHQL